MFHGSVVRLEEELPGNIGLVVGELVVDINWKTKVIHILVVVGGPV